MRSVREFTAVEWLLVAFAVTNALLYSAVMPLWEGFDEPFHYGYVETLATRGDFPTLGRTRLSAEIWESLKLAPASHVVKQNLPFAISFGEYFALTPAERAARRHALWAIDPALRNLESVSGPNYEAQQTPLAYLMLAPFSELWRSLPLPLRVFRLRLVCALGGVLALLAALFAISRELELTAHVKTLLCFLVLSWQILYATAARISNDWLALALIAWFFVFLHRYEMAPSTRTAVRMGAVLAAALLAKAYALAFVPLAVFAVLRSRQRWPQMVWLMAPAALLAAPWYVRNVALYGSFSGTQQSVSGVDLWKTYGTLSQVPWMDAVLTLAHGAVWTGNNTFNAFSSSVVGIVLLLQSGALVSVFRARRPGRFERYAIAAVALFVCALLYQTAAAWAHFPGRVTQAPWYATIIALPLGLLCALGFEAGLKRGAVIAAAAAAYMIVATYVVKLVPMYSGCVDGKATVAALKGCYVDNAARTMEQLSATALGPVEMIVGLMVALTLLTGALVYTIARRSWSSAA